MMRRLSEKQLGENTAEASDDIIALQGVNKEIMERLRNEDITTVTQIAYCDPVRLVMRSNLTFNFVTDCMGQALAWLYFEDKLAALRPLGMRGAVEIKNLMDDYDAEVGGDRKLKAERDRAAAALLKIAEAIKQDPSTVEAAFREIAGDPYTEFLSEVWT